jgi:hypothetical protein
MEGDAMRRTLLHSWALVSVLSGALWVLPPTAAAAGEAATERIPATPNDPRIQKRPTTPTYASEPTFAHTQCANSCQVIFDRAVGACQSSSTPGSALNACVQQARAAYLASVNACPADAARLK